MQQKALKQAAEMKHKLSACILIPSLARFKEGIKMDALSLCFISAACFSTFYCSPNYIILKISHL